MTNTQKRYTDDELIALLRVLASDLNKRPTQREILKDSRMPTHHTYIKRFGSMKEALALADLDTLEDRSYTNDLALEMLQAEFGTENVHVQEDDVILTCKVDFDGKSIYVDFVDLVWTDGGDHTETIEEIKRMRRLLFESTDRGEYYRAIEDLREISLLTSHYME